MIVIKPGFITLLITYIIALTLMVMPMPAAFDTFRPDWPTLVMLYWIIALPHRVNMGTALVLGVLSDILLGSIVGVHALGMVVVTYFAARHFQRIRNFALIQQALVIAVLILLSALLCLKLMCFCTTLNLRSLTSGQYSLQLFFGYGYFRYCEKFVVNSEWCNAPAARFFFSPSARAANAIA